MAEKEFSKSKKLAARVVFAALTGIKKSGGQLPVQEVLKYVEDNTELDAWAKEKYEKTGYIRWQSILHFYSIDVQKAGFLLKKNGVWYITPEGEEAVKLGEIGLHKAGSEAYKKWKITKGAVPVSDDNGEVEELLPSSNEEYQTIALAGIKKYIFQKNPYEFQELAAALLRGMGYFTPFVAPKGKDGGVDIIAYKDPLGTESPRIKIQIKHRENPAAVSEIRQLLGLLPKSGDIGIFISSGGFTSEARGEARSSHSHVELIDLDRFISLWIEFYEKVSDEDKNQLPLLPIYFVHRADPA